MSVVLVNGAKTNSVTVSDRSLQYRDGVWEILAIPNNQPQFLKEHVERLEQGCNALSLPMPDLALLQSEIQPNQQHSIHLQLCHTRLAHNPPLADFKHLNLIEPV